MKHQPLKKISRRSFVKNTTIGAAAFGFSPYLFIPKQKDPLKDGFQSYHPNVDPFRVVGLHDPEMTMEKNPITPWRMQEKLVRKEVVEKNLDLLACALTKEKKAQEAWKGLFIKPPGKSWSDVSVAIKTNNIARQHTRSAVMAKICRVFTENLGVKASHITIYDACHGRDMLKKTPFSGLPEGCQIAATWGGFTVDIPVGEPWRDGNSKAKCVGPLANGKVDILVNIALCKGHSPSFGRFTMSMKNHLGTFNPRPHAHAEGATDYLIAINKTPEILGEVDPKKKKILFPRQQLCLIDALWASEHGPGCETSAQPNRLFMGTFAPALDYLVAHEFRKGIMGWTLYEPAVDRFLTEFGFTAENLPKEGIIKALET